MAMLNNQRVEFLWINYLLRQYHIMENFYILM